MSTRKRSPSVQIVEVAAWPPEWAGWHFNASGQLVSPERHRITPHRLQGLIWRQDMEARRDAARARREARRRPGAEIVTVVRVRNDDWHAQRFGTSAG